MPEIIGIQRAREVFGNFELHHFSRVVELRWYLPDESALPCIDMTLSAATEKRRGRIRLRFEGVSDFKIEDWGSGNAVINGLDIADVSNRQLEGIVWQVFDYEDGKVNFFCSSAEVLSAERL
jgi:hypothetical protein